LLKRKAYGTRTRAPARPHRYAKRCGLGLEKAVS